MSISSISSASTATTDQLNTQRQRRGGGKIGQDMEALSKALQSGDLNAAKTAFSTMQTDFKNGPPKPPNDGDTDDQSTSSTSATGKSGTSPKDLLAALSSALDSGDLSAAKTAFSDLQKAGKRHHHGQGGGQGEGNTTSQGDNGVDSTNSVSSTSFEALIKMTSNFTSSSGSSTSSTASSDYTGTLGKLLDFSA